MKIDETLSLVKELHIHSIINGDTYYSDKLLQIIINLSTAGEVKNLDNTATSDEAEIAKVKRKIPKWMKKTHQYNYLILKAFMDLSNYNENRVPVDELEEYVNIGKAFLANYNNLKTISEKNHGKVFDEIDRQVVLWEPVAEFIVKLFQENQMTSKGKIVDITEPVYMFQSKEYKKGQRNNISFRYLVLDVIKKYLDENREYNYRELQDKFNSLHSSKVILDERDYIQWLNAGNENDTKRYFDEPVIYNNEKYYILTQWSHDKIHDRLGVFVDFVRNELGYDIHEIK